MCTAYLRQLNLPTVNRAQHRGAGGTLYPNSPNSRCGLEYHSNTGRVGSYVEGTNYVDIRLNLVLVVLRKVDCILPTWTTEQFHPRG